MTPFAHVATGYLTNQLVDLINPSLKFNQPEIILVSIFAANLPDFDVLFMKEKMNHRNSIFHAPLFWLLIIAVVFIVIRVSGYNYLLRYLIAIAVGLATHFFSDWFAAREKKFGGIRLLYPFSNKHYGMLPLDEVNHDLRKNLTLKKYFDYYYKNKFLFYAELFITALAAILFLNRSFVLFLQIFQWHI